VDCSDGTCTSSWVNDDYTYSLSAAITESDEESPQTLRVAISGSVVIESPGLTVVSSPVG
jgi:hypothetical protein